jgi:hypothetical protein
VKFFERSAGGRPFRGSEDQSQTPQTWISTSFRVVVWSSVDEHSGHRTRRSMTFRAYASGLGEQRSLSDEPDRLSGPRRGGRVV